MPISTIPCTPAPSCVRALHEATTIAPNRRTSSDGICASSTHHQQNPGSDHEPNIVVGGKHYATAVDVSQDKDHFDAEAMVEKLRIAKDERIKYVISERHMYSSYASHGFPPYTWRPYSGPDPHTNHVHISILPAFIFDARDWWTGLAHIPAAPLYIGDDGLMLGKDEDDIIRATISEWCVEYWGRRPKVDEQTFLLATFHGKGRDLTHAAIYDDDRAKEYRKATPDTH